MIRRVGHLFGKALRETGQAIDRLGLRVVDNELYRDTFSRHRPIMSIYDKRPRVATEAFVAPNASVIGEVLVFGSASIWYGAVVRGDRNLIKIGGYTNVQDRAVINSSPKLTSGLPAEVDIGSYVTIGHGAVLQSCTVKDNVLIGMNSVIQEGSVIESNSMVAAGAVVEPETHIPSGQLWAGFPARYVRDLTEEEIAQFKKTAIMYSELSAKHKEEFLPYGTIYQQAEALKR